MPSTAHHRLDQSHAAAGWVVIYVAIVGAWAVLYAMAAEHATRLPLEWLGPGMSWLEPLLPSTWQNEGLPPLLSALCLSGPGAGDSVPLVVFHMWSLMALAMMLPTALPVMAAYRDMTTEQSEVAGNIGLLAFTSGYVVVWLGFATIATLLQIALAEAEVLHTGGRVSTGLAAALLIGAGLYQLTPMKAMCLAHCRSPVMTLMARWRSGAGGAFRMGTRNGLFCLGCCWALMLLAFVGGTMNLVWMGIATGLMALEKLPRLGRPLTLPLGIVLVSAGLLILVSKFAAPYV
jgi:predicted metal-binding membrane protein